MEKIFVFADFDWLKESQLIGELCYERLRGSDSYAFQFDTAWLREHADIALSADINNYSGMQYTQPGKDIFGCFSDALPDRWGRTLLKRREQILAEDEKRAPRNLSSFDFLIGIDDFSRMGGFRFKKNLDDKDFINSTPSLKIPPLTDIRELLTASEEIEKSEESDILPEKKWVAQLIQPGTSLGGARPKSGVMDENGNLCIAKFPSRKDDYDAGLWEHFSHQLAQKAGIQVAKTRVLAGLGKYHTLLSTRFDRTADGRRIHFASSLSLLGLTDGDNASNGGYGYLLTQKGWTLSPAYDMNPTLNEYQSLLINSSTNKADLMFLLDSYDDYMLDENTAKEIISEVVGAMKGWEQLASELHISPKEQQLFKDRFNSNLSFGL